MISVKVYAITLLKNNTDRWTADVISKKNEEYMLRSIVQDDISGDNGMLGGGVKRMKCKKMDSG